MTAEIVYGEVTRIDHDIEDRAWLLGRFKEMTQDIITTWDIAQDVTANWTDGRNVSRLEGYEGKALSQVFREWVDEGRSIDLAPPSKRLLQALLRAARIKQLAPSEYQNFPWSFYGLIPQSANADFVADTFRKAAAQPVAKDGVTQRAIRLTLGTATGMKAPYWQRVIEALMFGEHDLTASTARNIAATAMQWVKDNPDAPTRR